MVLHPITAVVVVVNSNKLYSTHLKVLTFSPARLKSYLVIKPYDYAEKLARLTLL